MDIEKINWQKTVERKADLQKAIQFSCNGAGGFGSFFGIKDGLPHQLFYFDGRSTSGYFSGKEYNMFLKKVFERLEDINFLKKWEKGIVEICKKSIEKATILSNKAEKTNNPEELKISFVEFDEIWNNFYPIGWSFFFIAGFEDVLQQRLFQLGITNQEAKRILEISARPGRISPVVENEIEILKLAKMIKSGRGNYQKCSRMLSEKFGWISVYNTEDMPRTAKYYVAEAKKIIKSGFDIQRKISSIEEEIRKNEKLFKLELRKIKNKLLKEQLKFLHVSGYLREKREEIRDRVTILEKNLYAAIAKNIDMSICEVVHLSNNEIKSVLGKKVNIQKLRKTARSRISRYAFIVDRGELTIIDNPKQIDKIAKLLSADENVKKIEGQVAYNSSKKIIGSAKIVLSNSELGKIHKGDVLITAMTKPDFVAAMKRAVTIITDEGGITCHAAIIARELKKPCIIGTKIATKVLKDGDLVEVDADRGIIKIIKKAK